jgi:phosphohistidine swiveling domain-containing protein
MTLLVPVAEANQRKAHGGKGRHLAFLTGLGMRVPDGVVVPTSELERHVTACGDAKDLAAAITARALRPELAAELRAKVAELGGRVSVRSSATLEDAKTHSFAGQFLTVLNVGPDAVEDAVRRVWASAFTENVRAYLRRAELDERTLGMAVVVQRQIDSKASGVAMGDGKRVIVEAVLGQGEALVSSEAATDQWEVEGGKITTTKIASKATRRVIPPGAPTGTLAREDVPEAERTRPALTNEQVLEIAARCAKIAAACEGRPQDCEFAMADGELHLLQTRDVTASLPVSVPALGPFAAPGKGSWELDMGHFRHPCTLLFQEIFPDAMSAGFKKASERYGALLSHMDIAYVNGFTYGRMRPVAAPEDATSKAPPPRWLFKLLVKVAPPLRRRVKAAEQLWVNREWRVQLEEWKAAKKRAVEAHLRLQTVDIAALDDAALIEHFRAARKHARAMVEQHHTYNFATLVPIGDLVAHVEAWTKGSVTTAEVLAPIAGASPISADLRSPEARAVGLALGADAAARRLLALDEADRPIGDEAAAKAVNELKALPGDAGARVREFLAHREYRLSEGLDPAAPCLHECPSLLWMGLRSAAIAAKAPPAEDKIDEAALAKVRQAVPEEHRAELATMFEEARATASLRDERALYSDVWAWGILRTVVIGIGKRILERSPRALVVASDLVHASADEIESLLLHGKGPSATELETRAAIRRAYTTADVPALLGPAQYPPPPAELLPPGAARLTRAVMTILPHVLGSTKEQAGTTALIGCAASGGVWEGPAHIVESHDDVAGLAPGSVLVVGAGSSSFTMMAPLASAVVAEGGGLLSHVAIVCREYRIPCVCGCAGVLSRLRTGQRIRVDGTRGLVEILDGDDAPARPASTGSATDAAADKARAERTEAGTADAS